jgi:hypothetical protein
VGLPALLVEVTQAQQAAIAVEATHDVAVLAIEASAREAIVARDSTALRVEDAEGWAAMAGREVHWSGCRVWRRNPLRS